MHPLILIAGLWLTVGVLSLLTAAVIHTVLPIGPFLAAGIGLLVGMVVVLVGFLSGGDRTISRDGE